MKRIGSLLVSAVMLFAMTTTAFAGPQMDSTMPDEAYLQYLELRESGVLGEDITFEYWQYLLEESARLEKELESSSEYSLVYDSSNPSAYTSYSMEAGDVFITSSTVSSGFLGHAGISISSSSILHIAGPGEHPDTLSKNEWLNKYNKGWSKVYRHSDSTIAEDAAQWAEDTYKDSDAEYVITMDLESTDETYCSKLVWQAYYYGHTPSAANGPTWGVRLPYSLPDTIHNLDLVQEWL